MHFEIAYVLAFIGGFVPGVLWLFFWMSEDKKHPEPKRLILLSFCMGILAVPIALFLERAFADSFVEPLSLSRFLKNFPLHGLFALFVFAAIEEVAKFAAAYGAALWSKEVDEPIDYMVYLIAAALGFAAYETALFIFTPISNGSISEGIILGNIRAIGAMLLHIVASSSIGIFLAFAFYRSKMRRFVYGLLGLLAASVLHTIFNIAIINTEGNGAAIALIFVWIAVVVLLIMFERVKKIHPTFTH